MCFVGLIEKVLSDVKYDNGPFNLDLGFTKNGDPIIYEIAPRLGGNFLFDAIFRAYGVNLLQQHVNYLLGEKMSFEEKKSEHFLSNIMLHRKKVPENSQLTPFFGGITPVDIEIYPNQAINFTNNLMSDFWGRALFWNKNKSEVFDLINFCSNEEILI